MAHSTLLSANMPSLKVSSPNADGSIEISACGTWTFASIAGQKTELEQTLGDISSERRSQANWRLGGLTELDDVGALWIVSNAAGRQITEVPPQFDVLMQQANRAWSVGRSAARKFDILLPVVILGRAGLHVFDHLRFGIGLLGQVVIDIARTLRWPREFPLRELSANIFRSGVTALPVTMLVGFLVGVVLTYLSALQLKSYGADLLVINIVSVGVARELGPMLASIIAAGRSGSTMTAQLGVMRVTEEIEALQVMGISVTGRLVLPKLLGLAVAMPLVSFATDIAALGGGMLAARVVLGIEFSAFLEALPRVLDVAHFWIGIGKSVVFGFAVAFVACHYGLRIRPNTESLGAGVTRSVVAAITAVILLDAIFAILLRNVP
jgi:phospholipid/cholesterol/gamma-HCH transport system permease protein